MALDIEIKEEKNETKVTVGANIASYLEYLKVVKNNDIKEFINLICLYYNDNSFLSPTKTSVDGGSTQPVCFVKITNPLNKKCIEALDIRGKRVVMNSESACASTEVVRTIFKDIDSATLEEIKAALAEEDLIIKGNDYGVYIIYAECLAEKAEELLKKFEEEELEKTVAEEEKKAKA